MTTEERVARRAEGARVLRQHDVGFRSYCEGVMLLVRGRVTFWPGAGVWVDDEENATGRGVWSLLSHLGVPVPPGAAPEAEEARP